MNHDIEQTIRRFIAENFLFSDDYAALCASSSLLEADILNSTGVLELVMFLEERFGFTVEDRDVVPENLDNINAITAYVKGRLQAIDQQESPALNTA